MKTELTVSEEKRQQFFFNLVPEYVQIVLAQKNQDVYINEKRVGDTRKVLIDRREGDYFIGRTEFDSPEVDNEVLIETKNALVAGEFTDVTFTRAEPFDLYGKA